MIYWQVLHSLEQIQSIQEESVDTPCLIFKHSTSCSISISAKMRLERDWAFTTEELKPYYLDVLSNRTTSKAIAEVFSTPHETPQVLLIRNGHCTYDASHYDVSYEEIKECYYDTY